jgi:sigma-B regulation protein RsbU (phosphoserine phosphatase)
MPSVYARYITERERLKMELDIARRPQLRMLPREVPHPAGLDIAAFSEPALEVGGDCYDFFLIDDRRLGVAIGDVSGKGMPAALYMTLLKGFLQSQATAQPSPRDLLSHVNRTFFKAAEPNVFVTLLYLVIDLERRQIHYARAGHNPFLVYRPATQATYVLQPPGIEIGLEGGDIFDRVMQEASISVQAGDAIALYTDGLTEACNGSAEQFGQARLAALLAQHADASAETALHAIRQADAAFVGRREAHDDLTCLVFKVT